MDFVTCSANVKNKRKSLSPLQGSIVLDNPKPGAALRLPLATLFRAFGAQQGFPQRNAISSATFARSSATSAVK